MQSLWPFAARSCSPKLYIRMQELGPHHIIPIAGEIRRFHSERFPLVLPGGILSEIGIYRQSSRENLERRRYLVIIGKTCLLFVPVLPSADRTRS